MWKLAMSKLNIDSSHGMNGPLSCCPQNTKFIQMLCRLIYVHVVSSNLFVHSSSSLSFKFKFADDTHTHTPTSNLVESF